MQHTYQNIPWWKIKYEEQDAQSAADAIRSECVSLGAITEKFEAKIAEKIGVSYVVATTSGSMALLMSLLALGVGPGDEVIVPNRTWIAAANAVIMTGAKVILVDVQSNIPIIDISKIEEKITSRTKAIIPTALGGRAVDMNTLNAIAKKHNLYVIEDAAQAAFSKNDDKFIGTQSDLGCFSLSVAKLIPTGQGGFIVTEQESLYRSLKKMRTHGVGDLMNCSFDGFGFNFRFTDLQASLGLSQLAKVDKKIESLKKIYYKYEAGLIDCKKIKLIPVKADKNEVPLYIEVLCQNRSDLLSFLQQRNIQSKAFYPNLNRAKYLNCDDKYLNADIFESSGLILPSGPDQLQEDIDSVIEAVYCYEQI